jgi:integrase
MEFIEFCKATGLRKKELKYLRGTHLVFKNGIYYIAVTSGAKGGRYRESPIISNVDAIVNRMKVAGNGKVWSYVPDMDVHSYRSDYCTEIYNTLARPLEKISKNERYYCMNDLKGVCYDKRAMLIASRCLGHNRINIIAEHYIR